MIRSEQSIKILACKLLAIGGLFLSASTPLIAEDEDCDKNPAKSREFLFSYEATVTDLIPLQKVRLWVPIPPSNEHQQVTVVSQQLPGPSTIGKEPKFGNLVLYVETQADAQGKIPLSITYQVRRQEVLMDHLGAAKEVAELERFLKPESKVPTGGKSLTLLQGKTLPSDQLTLGRMLYDVVGDHVRYSKEGTGWGEGDVDWVCDSRYGNCTDFHSLFISLARSKKIPARFEIGFPLPDKLGKGDIAGYHCWAWFKPEGKSWIPVDISEGDKNPAMKDYYFGNLTENRLGFSEGRDIVLVPPQAGAPLNYFVHPYVEVGGKAYPVSKITRRYSFQDLSTNQATK